MDRKTARKIANQMVKSEKFRDVYLIENFAYFNEIHIKATNRAGMTRFVESQEDWDELKKEGR